MDIFRGCGPSLTLAASSVFKPVSIALGFPDASAQKIGLYLFLYLLHPSAIPGVSYITRGFFFVPQLPNEYCSLVVLLTYYKYTHSHLFVL